MSKCFLRKLPREITKLFLDDLQSRGYARSVRDFLNYSVNQRLDTRWMLPDYFPETTPLKGHDILTISSNSQLKGVCQEWHEANDEEMDASDIQDSLVTKPTATLNEKVREIFAEYGPVKGAEWIRAAWWRMNVFDLYKTVILDDEVNLMDHEETSPITYMNRNTVVNNVHTVILSSTVLDKLNLTDSANGTPDLDSLYENSGSIATILDYFNVPHACLTWSREFQKTYSVAGALTLLMRSTLSHQRGHNNGGSTAILHGNLGGYVKVGYADHEFTDMTYHVHFDYLKQAFTSSHDFRSLDIMKCCEYLAENTDLLERTCDLQVMVHGASQEEYDLFSSQMRFCLSQFDPARLQGVVSMSRASTGPEICKGCSKPWFSEAEPMRSIPNSRHG